jgi:hypothetical protein
MRCVFVFRVSFLRFLLDVFFFPSLDVFGLFDLSFGLEYERELGQLGER